MKEFCYYLLRSGENEKNILINHAFNARNYNLDDLEIIEIMYQMHKTFLLILARIWIGLKIL